MAAAAVAAGTTLFKVFRGRQVAELEGLVHLFVDGFLNFMQLFLGLEEIPGDGIREQRIAILFKIRYFLAVQRLAGALLVLQGLAFGHELFVMGLRFVVRQKSVNALAGRTQRGFFEQRLAKLAGFLSHNRFSNFSGHKANGRARASCPVETQP